MNKFRYGYNDPQLVKRTWERKKTIYLIFAILFVVLIWFFLNQKLLLGEDWISETYDNEEWKTNEGDLSTNGAWDLETHIWKAEYILKHYPNFHWSEEWYMGVPLLKYYQSSFYIIILLIAFLTSMSIAKSALFFVIFGHLVGGLLAFLLYYKVSGKIGISAFLSVFLFSASFISLRSYGWEPISVAFLFLFPLGLLIFLRQPLKPFRFWMVVVLSLAYLAHPLIWFSLNMTMGIFLMSIAMRKEESDLKEEHPRYILMFFLLVIFSLLLGAIQFLPQFTYDQVTSGAHMGVTYLPFYHVQYNVISFFDFLFDAGNLKGPGFIIMVAFVLVILFYLSNRKKNIEKNKSLIGNALVAGLLGVLALMVLFYYAEKYNIFPMNIFRSVQYHRIVPEFIIVASTLVASMSNIVRNNWQRIFYYGIVIAFSLASLVLIYNIQTEWQTIDRIDQKPEFIYDEFEGRISFSYQEQSLSVRNSFREIPQVYGYYEQGITNSYADEIFSVSSGFHDINVTLLYLEAANVQRFYINKEEGKRSQIMYDKMSMVFNLTHMNERYGYFDLELKHPELIQEISLEQARNVKKHEPGCRKIFEEEYCGSVKEEFVTTDFEEQRYLRKYINLLDSDKNSVDYTKINPQHYKIHIESATEDTAILVKMTHSKDFIARINDKEIEIEKIGPDFMLIAPKKSGTYVLDLEYHVSNIIIIGGIISLVSFILLIIISIVFYFNPSLGSGLFKFRKGDLK